VEVSFSSAFKRAFKKRIKGNTDLEEKFWQKLEQFTIEPFAIACFSAASMILRASARDTIGFLGKGLDNLSQTSLAAPCGIRIQNFEF
jgi:hypothetical protein